MWKYGDVVAWRGIYRSRIWHAGPIFIVRETHQEIVNAILPGAKCMMEQNYAGGIKDGHPPHTLERSRSFHKI